MREAPLNPSPYLRFAHGLSGAILIGVVLACGYTFGKRISSAEAAVDQTGSDITLSRPDSSKPDSGTGSVQPPSQKSDSDTATGASGSDDNTATAEPSAPDASHAKPGAVPGGGSVEAVRGDEAQPGNSDRIEFNATAYCLTGYTAAGIATHRGMIAADPRILPLGSVVHILAGDYSGTYLVLDTGARIKGRRIDIYMPDRREAMSFGRRSVRVKVIGKVRPSHLRPR
jgi:3D (Asp-Asp-Asp) domain-containing protein